MKQSKVLLVFLLINCNVDKEGMLHDHRTAGVPINIDLSNIYEHGYIDFDELFSQFDLTNAQINIILYLKSVLADSEFVVRDADGVRVNIYDDHGFYELLFTILGDVRTKTVAEIISGSYNAKLAAEAAIEKVKEGAERDALNDRFASINDYYRKELKLAFDCPEQVYTRITSNNFDKLNLDVQNEFNLIEYDAVLIAKIFDQLNLNVEEKGAIYYLRDVLIGSKFSTYYPGVHKSMKPFYLSMNTPKLKVEEYTNSNFNSLISKLIVDIDKFKVVITNIVETLKAKDEALAFVNMVSDITKRNELSNKYFEVDNDYKEALRLACYDFDEVYDKLCILSYAKKFEAIKT
ncbi:hypothetical protein bcCo53_001118 (plasmid) [Borrelia coriaceae]|uniref:Uncharacterized protein n=1 Tax=Borrelia coriaceae ATCC 43381 TaxID=1408429 RepID=W5SW64_9SPIR|nr:hypothetical protein [Borrelia coriaceae]AHH11180.1 hypothetical protein BCO_0029500 [Borrelia coriaceae ATCC 43381]UPA16950.1 hypothetical protein bcCo53_001118 [Borrelia coriaceae]